MQLNYLILPSILLTSFLSIYGMEKSIEKSRAPLLFDKTTFGGMLPSDLHEELIKFITNNKKHPALNFWALKCTEKNGVTNKDIPYFNRGAEYDIEKFEKYEAKLSFMDHFMSRCLDDIFGLAKEKRKASNCITIDPKGYNLGSHNIIYREICPDLKHEGNVINLSYDPDRNYLTSISDDPKIIKVWNLAGTVFTAESPKECVKTLEFKSSPDHLSCSLYDSKYNRAIYGSLNDSSIKLWDLETDSCAQVLSGHKALVSSLAHDSQHNYLFSGSYDRTIKIWDLDTGSCLKTFAGHTGPRLFYDHIHQLLFSGGPNSNSYEIKVWDIETGSCLHTTPRKYEITSLAGNNQNCLYTLLNKRWVLQWHFLDQKILDELYNKDITRLLLLISAYNNRTLNISGELFNNAFKELPVPIQEVIQEHAPLLSGWRLLLDNTNNNIKAGLNKLMK